MAANTASSDDGDPAQQQSGITPPQLSVPKGGGAIRGIDEKFTTNPVTGTGSFNIPFPLSPGRSGFGPQLSLGYDSGSGNGCFGMGWSASLPMISRRTDKGIPRYRDGPSDDAREEDGLSVLPDIFILSGAEDLVPVLQYDAEEKWRIEEVQHDGYRIQRYRPRIEGLFAQIEYWRSIAGGDSHWRSISKDNTLTLYGTGPDSRIADPANPAHVFSWLVSQSFDNKGNAIIYDYAGEEDAVASSASNERNRVRSANRCLKRIRYGNRIPLAAQQDLSCADWMFEVVFDYGEGHYREDPPDEDERIFAYAGIAARDKALVRKDPFSTYRSGFEIRQYRLCRRVLMFHHFPQELGTASYLVRSMAFDYHEKAVGSFITRIVQCGHKLQAGQDSPYQRYFTRKSPPLTLTYTASPLEDTGFDKFQLHEVAPENLANLAGGIDGSIYRWLDLDAEGIPGVLSEQEDGWFYKPNLGDARFGATQLVHARPAIGALNGGDEGKATQLMDMTGDGNLDLVALGPPGLGLAGFHARTQDHSWEGFRPFRAFPVRDWDDPNLRFVDLTGDGIADVLVTEDDAVTWHPSLLALGFGAGLRVRTPQDEESGPRVIFSDLDQSVYLADMSGDGMSDIVRIRNGEICYWPNLGYGRFGAKITMDNAPRFDTPDLFDQSRIRLADTDGGGTADILYFARDSVRIYLNESGNSWSEARQLHGFPAVDKSTAVVVTDFLGRGTACLLWSSSLPHDAGRQLRYVDLMCGQKPHLLIHVNNNLGAETRLEYASSTEFYLADKAAGTPWITRLPFPVHVVKRVETYDYVSRNRFVSRYSYHHGFYDGVEREFRGFARVDQRDTEEFSTLTGSDAFPAGANLDAASSVPPILTKTWFHTGAFLHGQHISRQLTHEYYREGSGLRGEAELSVQQAAALQLPDTMLPPHLTAEDAREACRSLKGAMLRQEVYALDDGAAACRPYTASENNYTIRLLQKKRDNRHAVFFTHARESLNFNYDRKLYKVAGKTGGGMRADPRVTHGVTLAVDDYGNVLTSVAIAYGRRFPDPSPLLTQEDRDKQAQILLTLT
ncbi:MAG: SpvB/TcaC N-terminal domain-containing protein, partial [Collimonas sp.]|uniref:SpvB/TcaC N-terminal domain-containing protein n=1 Tax=Collimonas sp. TaxID=1963772 RepID=UPI0032643F01